MPSRFILILAALALSSGGCIFAPKSSTHSDAGDSDVEVDDRCSNCLGTWAGSGVRGSAEGPQLEAQFDTLTDIAVEPDASSVYLTDELGHRIWRVRDGQVESFAGTGTCSRDESQEEADDELCTPNGMQLVGPADMYVTECSTSKIKRVEGGEIRWVAGTNDDAAPWEGLATEARLNCPSDIVSGDGSSLYIAGNRSHRIHEFSDGQLEVLAGGEQGYADSAVPAEVQFNSPSNLVHDADNERLIVLDRFNHCLRAVSLSDGSRGETSTIAGKCGEPGPTEPGAASATRFDGLRGLEFDGDLLYLFARSRLIAIDFSSPELEVEALLGIDATSHHVDGPADRAKLHGPRAIAPYVDERGQDSLLIAEYHGRTVRKWKYIDPDPDQAAVPGDEGGPTIETVAGTGLRGDTRGDASQTEFASPFDVIRFGGGFLIADQKNHQILEYQNGEFSVFAGTGECAPVNEEPVQALEANLCQPSDLFVDGRRLFVVQRTNHVVSKIDLNTSTIETVVGSARPGTEAWDEAPWQGDPLSVKLFFPEAVTLDAQGNLYIAGGQSHAIHRLNAEVDDVSLYAGKVMDAGHDDRALLESKFNFPRDIIHVDGNLFVADFGNHCIRQLESDQVKTALGKCEERGAVGGSPNDSRLDLPLELLSTDYDSDEVPELIVLDRVGVSILDGDPVELERVGVAWEGWRDGALNKVGLTRPTGVAVTDDGSLLVTERDGDRLREITF